MSRSDSPDANARTLAGRIADGKIPVPDALRYALLVAGSLRQLHEQGRVHGALSCADVILHDESAELVPAEAFWGRVTPYTAPELLAGQTPDARSDIFSFGAMVYELLTARRAFTGDTPAALAAALRESQPTPSGSAILDRFLKYCLAKDPQARWRIGKVQLELKLMAAAVRRGAPGVGSGGAVAARESDDSALRAEVRKLEARVNELEAAAAARPTTAALAPATLDEGAIEARIAARLTAQITAQITAQMVPQVAPQERAVVPAVVREIDDTAWRAELQRLESRLLARIESQERIAIGSSPEFDRSLMRSEIQRLESRLLARVESHERAVDAQLATARDGASGGKVTLDSVGERVIGRLERGFETVADRVGRVEKNAKIAVERGERLEQSVETDRQEMLALRKAVAEDIESFEKALAGHSAAVETARTAIAQTDELVERVVEALEQLQSVVMERPAEPDAVEVN